MRQRDGLRGDSCLVQFGRTAVACDGRERRLEFVEWARDGRHQLTPEDNKIWLHMKEGLVTSVSWTTLPKKGWSVGGLFPISLLPVLGSAATCSSNFADTSSQIVTLPRAKKTGPRSASQTDSVVSECASLEASIPLGGDATTFRDSLLTKQEEATTNQRKDDNGSLTGEQEAWSNLPDVLIPAGVKTEGCEGRAEDCGRAHGCRAHVRSSATA